MVYKTEILESAQRELTEIVGYLAAVLKNPQAAEAFLSELDHQVALIENDPYLYSVSHLPELAARNYRVAFVKSYVMLYTLRGNTIYIAHIFHQRQDYARLV